MEQAVYIVFENEMYVGSHVHYVTTIYDDAVAVMDELEDQGGSTLYILSQYVNNEETVLETVTGGKY